MRLPPNPTDPHSIVKKKHIDDADKVSEDLPFEAALTELEGLLERMESGRLTLEESVSIYHRGAALLRHCQAQLDEADARLRILEEDSLKPLDIADGSST